MKQGTYKNKEARKTYLKEYNKIYQREYRKRLKIEGKVRIWDRNAGVRIRRRALEFLGEVKCSNCGCDIIEILEINHVKGGGVQEHKLKGGIKVWRDIYLGRVPRENYNILCRVCNALEYVERKFGIKKFMVTWDKPM